MRTLVVGDIHGCADELGRLIALAKADAHVSVGDLFTKGPDPVGVWGLLKAHGFAAVLGNHDERLLRAVATRRSDDKGARRCVAALDAADPGWLPWVKGLPLFLEVAGWTVVHASLHPSGDLAQTSRADALFRRRIPDTRDGAPWTSVYAGSRRVVYGHDAVRGLVRVERDGQPWLMGLDSGCVYGGRLTGYVLETDEVVTVDAARVYKKID